MTQLRTVNVPYLGEDGRLSEQHTPAVVEQRLAALESAVAELAVRVTSLETPAG